MNLSDVGKTKVMVLERIPCDNCGEPATNRVTYLYNDARTNPASKGYGRDDISWCADDESCYCDECLDGHRFDAPADMSYCATFKCVDRFAHMFLRWVDKHETPTR